MASRRRLLRIDPAPSPLDPDLEPLMSEPFASAWSTDRPAPPSRNDPPRQRLLARLAASKAASAAMVTVRLRRTGGERAAAGVLVRKLYAAEPGRALRPGEPLAARLVELQPGACWTGPGPAHHREWLLLQGQARVGTATLRPRDYRVTPSGSPADRVHSERGALLFLRESLLPEDTCTDACTDAPLHAYTVHDAEADWPDFAPGIRRRVLWQHGGQAALLYHAEPGAAVPMHRHGHDEECLMVQGELFLDDVLLQGGDYQLAPAGTGHRATETDTGVVLYAHGDLDLRFVG